MARVPDLLKFAKKHHLNIITIQDLIKYRIQNESFIEKVENVNLPTDFADFELCYKDILNDKFHFALTLGDFKGPSLVRVHSECITGDVLAHYVAIVDPN